MQQFRTNEAYRLEQARVPEDLRSAPRRRGPASGNSSASTTPLRHYPRSSPTSVRSNLRPRNEDRWVFVGNLPLAVNEQMVREVFGRFGSIMNVNLNTKQSSMNRKSIYIYLYEDLADFCQPLSSPHSASLSIQLVVRQMLLSSVHQETSTASNYASSTKHRERCQ